jgi:hypothetical protein
LAEWLYEAGIGEDRAILVDDDRIIEARIEWPGLRAGAVADARLTRILVPGKRGIATADNGEEVLVEPLDRTTEGATIRVEILREAIPEPGAVKRAKGRITDAPPGEGPDLATRIGMHRAIGPRDSDLFEQFGWSELLEQAASGIVPFDGGTVRISLTPAMTLIDIDGALPTIPLAVAGAKAAAQTIRLFDIAGNIGIDLPTVAGKAERLAIAEIFDAVLPAPFERTAVNGFGFLQIIRPRARASMLERAQFDAARFTATALMRRVQHAAIIGACQVVAPTPVINVFRQNTEWLQQLECQNGGPISLHIDQEISISNN